MSTRDRGGHAPRKRPIDQLVLANGSSACTASSQPMSDGSCVIWETVAAKRSPMACPIARFFQPSAWCTVGSSIAAALPATRAAAVTETSTGRGRLSVTMSDIVQKPCSMARSVAASPVVATTPRNSAAASRCALCTVSLRAIVVSAARLPAVTDAAVAKTRVLLMIARVLLALKFAKRTACYSWNQPPLRLL